LAIAQPSPAVSFAVVAAMVLAFVLASSARASSAKSTRISRSPRSTNPLVPVHVHVQQQPDASVQLQVQVHEHEQQQPPSCAPRGRTKPGKAPSATARLLDRNTVLSSSPQSAGALIDPSDQSRELRTQRCELGKALVVTEARRARAGARTGASATATAAGRRASTTTGARAVRRDACGKNDATTLRGANQLQNQIFGLHPRPPLGTK
jgi:hypothetical protein